MDESERLVAKAALAAPDVAVEAWREWRATYEIATATDLLTWAGGYIHRNLSRAGVEDPYLAGIHRYNFISNNRRLIAALPIIRDISERWPIAPLKSFGMSRDSYSRGLRPLADFDFWISARHLDAVREFIGSRGFTANVGVDEFEFAHRIVPQRGSWNYHDATGTDLDIHWRVFDHLGLAENENVVRAYSVTEESEFGPILRPSAEFALVVLGYHQQLEPANAATQMFDLHDLLGSVDLETVARLAAATRMERDLASALAFIRSNLDGEERPEVARLQHLLAPGARARPKRDEVVLAPRLGEWIPKEKLESGYLKRPGLYRMWWWLGRPAWLERILTATQSLARGRVTGDPTRPGAELEFPHTTGTLAGGWHYPYPAATFRWANAPEARVVFESRGDADALVVELDPQWSIAPVEAFDVVVNGHRLGTVEKIDGVVVLPLPPTGERVEVSLRLADQRRFRDPGMHLNWYRMLAPVVRIDLTSTR